MLELNNLNAGYGSFQALFSVNLEVKKGEAIAVIGPNGAGENHPSSDDFWDATGSVG